MKIGIVGVGHMGRVLATLLADHVELCLFDRNREEMQQVALQLNAATVNNLEEIVESKTVILAVPDHEVVSCIKVFNQLQTPIRVINIATNVGQSMLEKMSAPHVRCIDVKLIGHADEMAVGQRPVIIVNAFPADLVPEMVDVFTEVGQVFVGQADLVQSINTIAAQKALEAAVAIEETLKNKNITEPIIIQSAIGQVAAGILKAYASGTMGPFAREIIQSVKNRNSRN